MNNIVIDKLPLDNFCLVVSISRQFRIRMWVGIRLLWLAAQVMGCGLEIVEVDNENSTT